MQSDTEIIARVLAGETEAYALLIERYQQQSYGLARQLLGNHHDAEDCVQEAFVKAYEKLHTFKGKSRFYTWLYRIIYNLSQDKGRIKARRNEVQDYPLEIISDDAAGHQPATDLEDGIPAEISRAIDDLPPKQRMVFLLRAREALQFKEIADVMKMSLSSAKTNYHYAIKSMREKLESTRKNPGGITDLAAEGER